MTLGFTKLYSLVFTVFAALQLVAVDASAQERLRATLPLAAAAVSEWRSVGYDYASTYFNSVETKLTKDNVSQLAVAWQADIGGNAYNAPLQVDDRIFVTGPKDVRAFDAASGKELWRLDQPSASTLSFSDGMLYLNTTRGVLAIAAASGAETWRRRADTQRTDGASSVLALEDRLLVGASNGEIELGGGKFRGYLSALDRASGDVLWTSYTAPETANGAGIFTSPSVDVTARVAFATTANNYGPPATNTSDAIIAFDLDTGAMKWTFQAVANDTFGGDGQDRSSPNANFGANPVLYETEVAGQPLKLVAAGERSGAIHAVRREDGTRVWTRSLGTGSVDGASGIVANTTWSGKHVLVACNEAGPSTLYALDGATGEVVWQRKLAGSVWGRISVANGVGFVGNDTTLEAFDVESGALLYRYESSGTLAGVISVANGRVVFSEGMGWFGGTEGRTLTVLSLP